jgi:hypothetical protein
MVCAVVFIYRSVLGTKLSFCAVAGWTPLHHAALLAPPTLVSFLMTHGCSVFSVTRRNLTPLDIVTAHSVIPGRDDVALLLEESMRGEGWTGGRVEQKRRLEDARTKRKRLRKATRENICRVLDVDPRWWGHDSDLAPSESSDSEDDEDDNSELFVSRIVPVWNHRCSKMSPRLPLQIIQQCWSFRLIIYLKFSTR